MSYTISIHFSDLWNVFSDTGEPIDMGFLSQSTVVESIKTYKTITTRKSNGDWSP